MSNVSRVHSLENCPDFKRLIVKARRESTRMWRLCDNCFKEGHFAKGCMNRFSCTTCHKRHHTLLHINYLNINMPKTGKEEAQTNNKDVLTNTAALQHH